MTTKRFYNNDKHQRLSTVLEDDNEDVSCDQCEIVSNDNYHRREHTKSLHKELNSSCDPCKYRSKTQESIRTHKRPTDSQEQEENYFVTKEGDGTFQFVCKICKMSFATQMAIKLHDMVEHRTSECFYSLT